MSSVPRIAYDARLSLGQYRGMGRFLRQLIAGHERDFVGFSATGEQDPSLNLVSSGFHFFPLWEQLSIPSLARQHNIDLFLAPYNTGPLRLPHHVKLLLVVHDLIYLEPLPPSVSLYQNLGRAYRRIIAPRVLGRANTIVTVSNYSKERLVTRFGVAPSKIWVIPNSLDDRWFTLDSQPHLNDSYIFMVAGEAPNKNLKRALEAYALYRVTNKDASRGLKVAGVKSGFHQVFRSHAQNLGINEHVDFLPYLSDSEICTLYRGAELFVMPSLMEGFGIPVVEAMASDIPVLASSTTSLPEVGGEAARYFDPTSVQGMAQAISDLMADPAARLQMSKLGREQVRKFHPEVVNRKIREFWEACLQPEHLTV